MTLSQTPPDLSRLTPEQKARLGSALDRYATFAAEHGLRPWFAYVPCKLRVHREQLRFRARARPSVRNWTPDELPRFVGNLCTARAIGFVDTTPALRAEARASQELLFNSIYDTHLNARGAEIVALEMARAIGASAHGQ